MARMTELAEFLKAHDDYAVIGHICPDGDASGSCIALCLALRALGKRAFVCLPGGLPKMYRNFPCTAQIVPDVNTPFAPKTAFSVDVSTFDRMGEAQAVFESCGATAMLDHHATNEGFGDVYLIDGKAAASGELSVELIGEMGVEITPEMGTWLYIAICTDCGQFGFSSTRAETLTAAAECVRAGIDVDGITREVYRTRSLGRTRLLGMVLSGLEIDEAGGIAWARLTEDMLRRAGALREDNEGIVNYLVEIRGVEFACLAEERGANVTKFSLRSKARVDAARDIAVPLGGGGHSRAAGVTLQMPLEEALKTLLEAAGKAVYGDKN